ncbi:MAG: 50S ribosome-binding GTPase, partial [Leptospiraceae bacterium]|nr:50S ribosome-binding GTPase [Leptospiraceae bacterium]
MAIDRARTRELLQNVDEFFDSVTGGLPGEAIAFVKRAVMGPAFEEIRRLIEESRPPVLFLVGRSGHGKSSLINSLAGQPVAEIGDVKPTTPDSTPYLIHFPEQFSSWQVIDSRGIFESTRPDGAPGSDAVEHLQQDIQKHNPDVIMHVISAPEIRNLSQDLKVFRRITAQIKEHTGMAVPVIVVLNKVDTLGNPRDWPPATNARKAALIQDAVQYMSRDVLGLQTRPLDPNFIIKGALSDDPAIPGVVPVCSLADDHWNVNSLVDVIGQLLPDAAMLDFFQALRRKEQLRKISSSIIKRFAAIASGIGASPAPLSDFIV